MDLWDDGHELLALCLLVVRWKCKATALRDALGNTTRGKETVIEEKRHKPAVNFPPVKEAMVCNGGRDGGETEAEKKRG